MCLCQDCCPVCFAGNRAVKQAQVRQEDAGQEADLLEAAVEVVAEMQLTAEELKVCFLCISECVSRPTHQLNHPEPSYSLGVLQLQAALSSVAQQHNISK